MFDALRRAAPARPTPREPEIRLRSPAGVLYQMRLDALLLVEAMRGNGYGLPRDSIVTLELVEQQPGGERVQVLGTYHAFDFPRASED